jgi:hypothetical protein
MDLNHQIPNDVIPYMKVNDTALMYTLTDNEDNKCDGCSKQPRRQLSLVGCSNSAHVSSTKIKSNTSVVQVPGWRAQIIKYSTVKTGNSDSFYSRLRVHSSSMYFHSDLLLFGGNR